MRWCDPLAEMAIRRGASVRQRWKWGEEVGSAQPPQKWKVERDELRSALARASAARINASKGTHASTAQQRRADVTHLPPVDLRAVCLVRAIFRFEICFFFPSFLSPFPFPPPASPVAGEAGLGAGAGVHRGDGGIVTARTGCL